MFPFLNAIFRSDQWPLVNESFNFDLFGMGKTPADIALLPWRLTFQSSRFSEVPNGALGTLPLVLAIAPVALLLTRNIRVRFIAVFLLAALMAWSAYAQYARYFLAALPGAAILAGWLFSRLVSIRPSLIGIAAYPIALGLAVSGLPIFLASFWNVPGSIPWAVDLGAETRQAYLERALRQYGAYEWMRDNLPAGEASKILGVGFGEWPIAYSPVPVYIGHMTNTGYHILIADDVETALARVREAGFRYLMIDYFPRPTSWRTSYPLTRDHVIETRLRLLYANNYIYLYALDPADASTPAPQPVINDPRFGSVGSGQQGDWHQFGAAAPTANAPCAGVSVTRGGGYLQTFDARPNTLYQFSVDMQSRSAQPGSGMIEMAWTRAKNPGGSLSIEVEPLSTNLQTFDVASTSPDDATQGTLYVTSLDDQSVCVERASGVAR